MRVFVAIVFIGGFVIAGMNASDPGEAWLCYLLAAGLAVAWYRKAKGLSKPAKWEKDLEENAPRAGRTLYHVIKLLLTGRYY